MPVHITLDTSQIALLESIVGNIKNGVSKVLAPATNRALAHGATVLKKEIRKEYLIKPEDVPIKVSRATYADPVGKLEVIGSMMDLKKFRYYPAFAVSPMRTIMTAQVKKRGIGRVIKGGFIARMPHSGYEGPFVRATGANRLPIRKLITISPAIMASQPAVRDLVSKEMADTLAKRITHEITRVMRGINV